VDGSDSFRGLCSRSNSVLEWPLTRRPLDMDGTTRKMRLNGWQRLWVVLCVLWLLFASLVAFLDDPGWDVQGLLDILLIWFVPPIAVYALGLMSAWVIRGFRIRDSH